MGVKFSSNNFYLNVRPGRCPPVTINNVKIPIAAVTKIRRHALGPQVKLEGPHCYEEEAQSKRIILANWNEVATIYRKQALDIQNNYKKDLDIWHRNLGLCQ